MSFWNQVRLSVIIAVACCAFARDVKAQTFGIELHNNLMPASGGMGGASISRPQDLQSAIAGNPATLRQFRGTQFSFGGAWADVNYNVTQAASLPLLGVTPFSGTSVTPGGLLGNIGITQDLDDFGLPATMGMGLISNAGSGVNFRNIPESNGTSAQYLSLDLVSGISSNLTDRLSVGASVAIATSYLDGPFVDFAGMTAAYGFRGTVGANYLIDPQTTIGAYWQSKKTLLFGDAVLLPGNISRDVAFDHPANTGIGIARDGLMNGRLLLAADVVYKNYSQADLLNAIYKNQWCLQLGSQYAYNEKIRLRSGYVFAENPMKDAQLQSIGGINLADGVPGIRYVQGQFAAITEHRITGGVGVRDFRPGMDLDVFAGYGFNATDQFAATTVNLEGNYWLGFGTTWRFGGCSNGCSDGCNTQTTPYYPQTTQ